jgi:hypothetical protein
MPRNDPDRLPQHYTVEHLRERVLWPLYWRFDRAQFGQLMAEFDRTCTEDCTADEKKRALEDLVAFLFGCVPFLRVTVDRGNRMAEFDVRADIHGYPARVQFDIRAVIVDAPPGIVELRIPLLEQFQRVILAECRNKEEPSSAEEIRDFQSKVLHEQEKVAFFFTRVPPGGRLPDQGAVGWIASVARSREFYCLTFHREEICTLESGRPLLDVGEEKFLDLLCGHSPK